MIELIKKSIVSFHLITDMQGTKEILLYIKELNNKKVEYPQILYSGNKRNFEIKLDTGVDNMLISKTFVRVYMDSEELQFFEQRLRNALISKYFYPAEVCERKYKNKYVTIYCNVF